MPAEADNANIPIFHYTTEPGLYGILRSQTIWATHFSFLNDAKELLYAEKFLNDHFMSEIEKIIAELVEGKKVSIREGHTPRSLAELDGPNFVNVTYTVSQSLAIPCVASFCSHAAESNEYVHGLLSQWRGYGGNGGYAIELSKDELIACLQADGEANTHSGYFFTEVLYGDKANDDAELKEDLALVAKIARDIVPNMLKAESEPPDLGYSWAPFFRGVSRVKDAGFSEECEYRCVYLVPRGTIPAGRKPARTLRFREGPASYVPYVELCESPDIRLPIKRVLVGPHPRAELRKKALELFFEQEGLEIEVALSGIPYLPA